MLVSHSMSLSDFWPCLYRLSWNPLIGGVLSAFFAGVFALFGAIIGGRYVLRSMADQRRFERLAAGRALSAELELNVAGAAALAIAGKSKPMDYLVTRPPLLRAAFDQRLTLISELLEPIHFISLASLYARAGASFSLLETQARRGVPFTPGAVEQFSAHAEEFALAAHALAPRVWKESEQRRLDETRSKVLEELRASNENRTI